MSDPLEQDWDALVIGAGMGGGIAARALAEGGMRVLILERGGAGRRTEETRIDLTTADPVARAVRGLWPEPVETEEAAFHAPLGCGVGGSSVFYAATLERPEPDDLDGWPVSHAALRPFYERAETWLAVEGEADPLSAEPPSPALRPPPPATPEDAAILARLRANGLHPYRLHAGLRRLPGCRECLGRKCPRPCKMDGRSAGVEPALATGRAALVTGAEVLELTVEDRRVTGVRLQQGGTMRRLRARRVLLAAGALSTPRLLMASGLGGPAAGRHLMLHLNETFAIWPGRNRPGAETGDGISKGIGLRDLMRIGGERMGMVQAMGVALQEGEILHHLRRRLAERGWGASRLLHEGARLPAAMARRLLGRGQVFVGLLEDPPLWENRVLPGRGIALRYRVDAATEARRLVFRRAIRHGFRGLWPVFLHRAAQPNWGHACGTARMGTRAADSVADAEGRVHGMANLWIADASAFPTSLGVNPSLTIAALALRVADRVLREDQS
ncbi:Choline dehydrogenase [Rubellimicrobium thermophilum DSM 16684]|uniref:Choline dehydrogenase n=1 Tax=Rubellimicrobium thermophilum DSM 16684 TaxID=1123069 RepID=S9QT75_9RHOB|nr:GMC family oxidoreductase [Rubellimicrobium thermophilum]EPX84541.1 Choline dehydrogenase [Rubellimicrobium thermophilum DSM 16684]